MGRFPNIWRASKMLETSRCISIFGQIVATVPFYTRAYFDMGQYSINKSTIGRKWWKSEKKDPKMKIETGVIRFYLGRAASARGHLQDPSPGQVDMHVSLSGTVLEEVFNLVYCTVPGYK